VEKLELHAEAMVYGNITCQTLFLDHNTKVVGKLNVHPLAPQEIDSEGNIKGGTDKKGKKDKKKAEEAEEEEDEGKCRDVASNACTNHNPPSRSPPPPLTAHRQPIHLPEQTVTRSRQPEKPKWQLNALAPHLGLLRSCLHESPCGWHAYLDLSAVRVGADPARPTRTSARGGRGGSRALACDLYDILDIERGGCYAYVLFFSVALSSMCTKTKHGTRH